MKRRTHIHLAITFFIFLIICQIGFAQTTPVANNCYSINGMYVWGLYAYDENLPDECDYSLRILGNPARENKLLEFAKNNGINYLICYELRVVLKDIDDAALNQFVAFVKKAKTQYGIKEIGAAFTIAKDADLAVNYNNTHAPDEQIDVLNLEYEFWNTGNIDAGLATSVGVLNYFKQVGGPIGMETEVYIGRFDNQSQGTLLANAVDRVLIHFYRSNDIDIINYNLSRLQFLGTGRTGSKLKIAPIFSAEGTGYTADIPFMGDWLETHPIEQAFKTWKQGYDAISASWKNNLEVMGPTWFQYSSFMSNPVTPFLPNHITQQPVSQTACIGQTKSMTVQSTATNKVYYWLKNGDCLSDGGNISGSRTSTITISNISANDAGVYSCRVISYDASNPSSFISNEANLSVTGSCVQSPYKGTPWPIPGVIQAEDYDLGGQGVSFNDLTQQNEGGNTYRSDAVDVESCTDAGNQINVGYIVQDEWLEYTVNVSSTGNYDVLARIATPESGKKFHIELNGLNVSGPINVTTTGGWDAWQTVVLTNVSLTAGTYVMKLVMETGDFNVNYLEFKKSVVANLSNASSELELTVFPNPTDGVIHLSNSDAISYQIYSAQGQLCMSGIVNDQMKSIDASQLASGFYHIKVMNKDTVKSISFTKR